MLRLLKKLIDRLKIARSTEEGMHLATPVFLDDVPKSLPLAKPHQENSNLEAVIKMLVVVDSKVDFMAEVVEALDTHRNEYVVATSGKVSLHTEIIREDLSGLPWSRYWGDYWGVNTGWIGKRAEEIRKEYGDKFDSIVFIIDWDNWTQKGYQGILGWNLGVFYPDGNGYQIQLIKAGRHSVKALYLTLLMELFHAHDDFYRRATGKTLEQYFGVSDFDDNIVHGMAHQDEILSQEESVRMFGSGYDRWDYKPAFKAMTEIFIKLFRINSPTKDMQLQRLTETSKDIFAIHNGIRFQILNWDSYKALRIKDVKVEINPNLKSIPWGGVMTISPDEDPLEN